MQDEISYINRDVKEFLFENKARYEIFEKFQYLLNHIREDTYQETIQFVKDHEDTFFKDHANAFFFLSTIVCLSECNFKRLELFMDIIIHFSNEFDKQHLTKKESIAICILYPNTINYLFSKNFFSIETIIELSSGFKFLFANFYHEIVDYDPEYAQLIEKKLLSNENYASDANEVNFLNYVKNNRQEHFLNRKLNYHPSLLHKSIRDDDINSFQSLLSQNNFGINHKIENSVYERTIEAGNNDLSLIEISAIYGSIKVFKFLWMQERINIPDDLLKYAYKGCNHEIIHICESKCKKCQAYIRPIIQHQFELLDYYIENFSDEIENDESEEVRNLLKNYVDEENDKEENIYKHLNVKCLVDIISSLNLKLMKVLLPKIVFILKNCQYKDFSSLLTSNEPFLNSSTYDLELFKFLFNQKKNQFDDLTVIIYINANDVIKFLINEVKDYLDDYLDIYSILFICIQVDHDGANYILDLKKEIPDLFVFDFDLLFNAILFYSEDIVVKIIKLHNVFNKIENISIISDELRKNISPKMIISLYKQLSSFLPTDKLSYFASLFNYLKL